SNMPLVAVGVFLLWFGWFGFNGGSVLSADPALTSLVLVTTSMAAAAGILVYFSVIIVDKKIDDPVGAVSVHLVCGIWGTIAVALFGTNPEFTLSAQLTGIVAIGAYTVIFTLIVGLILKKTLGLRVSSEEEEAGLDVSEHGMKAYN
ncbi:MAG: ammonium transporter, partial [Planctomycetaceae bacterium]|nr:ammonium transporter [Planctomycetaceae bacterium]